MRVDRKRPAELKKLPDTRRYKIQESRIRCTAEKIEIGRYKVPFQLKNLRKLLLAEVNAIPHVKPYTPNPKYIKKYFKNDERLFTVTVYIARKHWKYDYYHQKDEEGYVAAALDQQQLKQ